MTPAFDENNEAINDLPLPLQQALRAYAKTGSDSDLNKVIVKALKDFGAQVTEGEITDELNFIQDLGLDSLAISEFVFFFEDFFRVRITNDELMTLDTLGELKEFLSAKLKRS